MIPFTLMPWGISNYNPIEIYFKNCDLNSNQVVKYFKNCKLISQLLNNEYIYMQITN